jgi:hypothetical protein
MMPNTEPIPMYMVASLVARTFQSFPVGVTPNQLGKSSPTHVGEGDRTEEEDPQAFARVLGAAVDALEGAGIPYAVFGSVAATHYGRPGAAEDIDIMVRRNDARAALEVLAGSGFSTDETDPDWIYKAGTEGVLLDVIFQVRSGIALDDEVLSHTRTVESFGRPVRLVSPEDQLLIEAVSDEEQAREHWFNGLSILVRTNVDWPYLEQRARYGANRTLSFLLYARSLDYVVPDDVLRRLFREVVPDG